MNPPPTGLQPPENRNVDRNTSVDELSLSRADHAGSALGSDYEITSHNRARTRVQRFYLQSVARKLIGSRAEGEAKIARGTCRCLRSRVDKDSPVHVLYASGTQSAHYGNVQVCGNVWLCAICGGKISERRRVEMTEGLARSSYGRMMATFTLRHSLQDSCATVRAALGQARQRFKRHRRWKDLRATYGIAHHIWNLEALHSTQGGWHLHGHEILLTRRELTEAECEALEVEMKALWGLCLEQGGRDASWEHGFNLKLGDKYVQEYLAKFDRLPESGKWSLEHELTKSAVKRSSKSGRTPYELLMLYGEGDEQAGLLWMEYAQAIKGAHQLQWSRGLKRELGIEEKSDDELANEQREPAELLASLSIEQWRRVLGNDLRAELLNIASQGDSELLEQWLIENDIKQASSHVAPDVDYADDGADAVQPVPATITHSKDLSRLEGHVLPAAPPRDYTAEYIQAALSSSSLSAPDSTKANGSFEALTTLFMAHERGGVESARAAWFVVKRLRPELQKYEPVEGAGPP